MIAVIDYGVGNLFSLKSSFSALGADIRITNEKSVIAAAAKIVLPGVGAFGDAAKKLKEHNLDKVLIDQAALGKPILGICLGMQLLFDKSYEYGEHTGLGLIKGTVRAIADVVKYDVKIPHMGWNSLEFGEKKHSLFKYIDEGDYVYFVHSYCAVDCDDSVIAATNYGGAVITAAAANGNVYGCQFHPEKSGNVGLKILKAFCETE
ncbi:MAG: imidazole glycerol phosphate synthase subunit HisH [Clostridia bacterium]|nr:imidazole glycerol phosphate synthase subunit HisH [Clostridia bacterium]